MESCPASSRKNLSVGETERRPRRLFQYCPHPQFCWMRNAYQSVPPSSSERFRVSYKAFAVLDHKIESQLPADWYRFPADCRGFESPHSNCPINGLSDQIIGCF